MLVAPSTVHAADPFACVDPDVAAAFLGFGHADQPAYSTTAVPKFIEGVLPEDFEFVASKTSSSNVTAVFRTKERSERALSRATEAMERRGWTKLEGEYVDSRGGFQSSTRWASVSMCRDADPGAAHLAAQERGARVLLLVSAYPRQGRQSCAETADASTRHVDITLQKHLPALDLPPNAESSRIGSAGGGDEYSAEAVIRTDMSRGALLTYFDDQIRNQQWVFDTGWNGSSSSGSVWTKAGSRDDKLVGVMRVIEASADVFNVRFTIMSVDPEHYFDGHSFSSSD